MTNRQKRKVVFVVGAGASKEARLPAGVELKARVASLLDIRFEGGYRRSSGDALVYEALNRAVRSGVILAKDIIPVTDINKCLHACWRIRDAMPQAPSIDNFIDVHRGDELVELCGKLGIVRAILEAERSSLLYVDRSERLGKINFKAIEETWYNRFF